jgi:membrane protein DedA with SNARE-associated domain
VGVQEFELLGDYRLNRGVYALQLATIWAAVEGTPHFGLLDRVLFGYSYARNFFDTDQRPIREVLTGWSGPTLIIHGTQDRLVPVSAAREHHRIIPQSDLVLLDDDHFLAFRSPESVAPHLARLVRRVEFGRGRTRDRASGARIADAAEPLELGALPPATGLAVVLAILIIAAGTFVSEDLTCIATGLLVARGMLGLPQGVFACAAGIWLGDVILWALGRYGGAAVVHSPPLRWIARPEAVSRSVSWFQERGGPLVLWSRFVSGARLPTYVAAGISGMSGWRFAGWAAAAAALWTPLLVGLSVLVGQAATPGIRLRPDQAWLTLGLLGLGLFAAVRTLMPLFTYRGRLVLRERLARLRRLEVWPL